MPHGTSHHPPLATRTAPDVPAGPACPGNLLPSAVIHKPELRLRGGGASTKRLPSNERVSRAVWFLAGGVGKPPTGGELREWKRKHREQVKNKTGQEREKFWAGFWGALRGGRKIKKGKDKNDQPEGGDPAPMTEMTEGAGGTEGGTEL